MKLATLFTLLVFINGCAASPRAQSPATVAGTEASVPVLTRSLYSKDASGSLTESDLQRVLESPIDLEFPARVGVVPLAEPFEAKGPVAIGIRSIAARDLARSLIGHPHFSHVSDISTDLPNVGGIEGLRTIAARYRLRYLLLYSERFEDATHLNGWAWLYPTVIGMFVAPGVTVESRGIAQADLLDVRTGTVLFSVVQPMEVSQQEWMIGAARSHKQHQADAASRAAKALAKRVAAQTNELVQWADEMAVAQATPRTRILPAPVKATPEASGAITAVTEP